MSNNMPLKDFIVSSLGDICSAVEDSRLKYGYVAPKNGWSPSHVSPTDIHFDVAVTVERIEGKSKDFTGEVSGDVGVRVIGFGSKVSGEIKGNQQNEEENREMNVNRIQFSVPVYFMLDINEMKNQMPSKGQGCVVVDYDPNENS